MIPEEIPETETVHGARLFAVRSDGLAFLTCVDEVIKMPGLLAQLDRLYGTSFTERKSPIDAMVDEATGRNDGDMQKLLRFTWNCVFIRLPKLS